MMYVRLDISKCAKLDIIVMDIIYHSVFLHNSYELGILEKMGFTFGTIMTSKCYERFADLLKNMFLFQFKARLSRIHP